MQRYGNIPIRSKYFDHFFLTFFNILHKLLIISMNNFNIFYEMGGINNNA